MHSSTSLGEAVVAQQTDVISAVESFRDRAYAAGNLKSDEYQTISTDEGIISIAPAHDDVIYVPYYEPTRVVYYQPRPVYYYHPRPYPVYYYPYAANHYFDRGFFWGVTTAFSIGWYTDSLNVYHHSYHGHPYYGRTYWNNSRYRQPSINVYNTTYVQNTNVIVNRDTNGDQWRARNDRREYVGREGYARWQNRSPDRRNSSAREYAPITFREREATSRTTASRPVNRDAVQRNAATRSHETARETRQQPVRRQESTRRQEPTVRTRDNTREQAVERSQSQRSTTYRPDPSRQTRQQTAPRETVRAPAPAPRERRQVAAPTREQPSRPRESRSQQQKSSTSNSGRSEKRSSERRRQNEERR
ncbi:MAG: DUF3300 domain-containing protein [Gammaproteobacteria bacterium]|nr:DUF3300 domain-containing protein [Gammaproteobacteria bacterium]